jgi:hypothetical protein
MRRSSTATLLTLVALLGVGCHDDSVPSRTVQDAGTSFSVRGVAQKGPFKFGSTVTVQELETDLAPNGRTFITETLDDLGTFALTSRLSAPLVEIIIDGEYYNEWWGADPTGEPAPLVRLPLRALVPARGSADAGVLTVNVNLLTHLQLPRQRVLLAQGQTFEEADSQSRGEVLAAFRIPASASGSFRTLNIVEGGDANGILLAVSLTILSLQQVHPANVSSTVSASEIIARVRDDLKDGSLDNATLIEWISYTQRMDLPLPERVDRIERNLRDYYGARGVIITVPPWRDFIDSDGNGTVDRFDPK